MFHIEIFQVSVNFLTLLPLFNNHIGFLATLNLYAFLIIEKWVLWLPIGMEPFDFSIYDWPESYRVILLIVRISSNNGVNLT